MIARAALALAAALAIAPAGCDKGSCKKRLATMQERLDKAVAWDTGGSPVFVELVEASGARPLEDGPALAIGVLHDGLSINHRRVPGGVDDVGLGEMIALEREAFRITKEGAPLVVQLWVDRRAPIATVRRVVAGFGLDEPLQLIARLPGELDIPAPPERVAAVIESIRDRDPSERATEAAKIVEGALGGCAPAAEVFGAMATVDPDAKVTMLGDKLVPAIARCGCKQVDVPLLEEMLLELFGARDPRRGWIPLDRGKMMSAANVAGLY